MDHPIWTKASIIQELYDYRGTVLKAEGLQLDIEAWEELKGARDDMIAAGALQSPPEPDMPRSSTTSDPTGRLAARLPDDAELMRCRKELKPLERQIRRVNAWMRSLPNRECRVIKMRFIERMEWREVEREYTRYSDDGGRSERTLRGFADKGIERLENYLKS